MFWESTMGIWRCRFRQRCTVVVWSFQWSGMNKNLQRSIRNIRKSTEMKLIGVIKVIISLNLCFHLWLQFLQLSSLKLYRMIQSTQSDSSLRKMRGDLFKILIQLGKNKKKFQKVKNQIKMNKKNKRILLNKNRNKNKVSNWEYST